MKTGLLRKMAAAGIAMLMLIALTPNMGLAATVTITYRANYGTGVAVIKEDKATLGTNYTILANTFFTHPAGLVFAGWNTKALLSGGIAYAPGDIYKADAGLTLFAQWKAAPPATVDVTYVYNIPVGAGPNHIDKHIKSNDYTIINPFTAPAGYKFERWNNRSDGRGGTSLKVGDTIKALAVDRTLYAIWVPTVTITYRANYGSGGAVIRTDDPVKDSNYNIWFNPFNPHPTGLTFIGWNTKFDGAGIWYKENEIYKASANLTLFAQWASTVTITYRANYGTGGGAVIQTDTAIKGKNYNIWFNPFNPHPTGKIFVEWNTNALLPARGISYAENEIYKADADLTLFAQWK